MNTNRLGRPGRALDRLRLLLGPALLAAIALVAAACNNGTGGSGY